MTTVLAAGIPILLILIYLVGGLYVAYAEARYRLLSAEQNHERAETAKLIEILPVEDVEWLTANGWTP